MFRNYTDIKRSKVDASSSSLENGFKCDMCNSEWLTETDVDIHRKKSHLRELLGKIKSNDHNFCLICVRDQKTPEALLSHIKSDHLLSSPTAHRVEREIFVCDACNHIFFNKMMLTAHLQYTHGIKLGLSPNIACPKCYKHIHVKKLWFHFLVHQMNILSTCQICFTDCKSTKSLREHLKSHVCHYACDTCSFVTNKDKYFENHIYKHKRRAAFIRKLEPRRYFVPRSFSGAWKYVCEAGVKGLQVHEVFICVLCREICSNKGEMRDHMFIDHAPETVVKKKTMCSCGEEFFNMVLLKHHVFKMKGDHRVVDDSDFGKLIAEDSDPTNAAAEKNDICNYSVVVDTDTGIVDVVPLQSCHEEFGELSAENRETTNAVVEKNDCNYSVVVDTQTKTLDLVPLPTCNEENLSSSIPD